MSLEAVRKMGDRNRKDDGSFYRTAVSSGLITISDSGVKSIDILGMLKTSQGKAKINEVLRKQGSQLVGSE